MVVMGARDPITSIKFGFLDYTPSRPHDTHPPMGYALGDRKWQISPRGVLSTTKVNDLDREVTPQGEICNLQFRAERGLAEPVTPWSIDHD